MKRPAPGNDDSQRPGPRRFHANLWGFRNVIAETRWRLGRGYRSHVHHGGRSQVSSLTLRGRDTSMLARRKRLISINLVSVAMLLLSARATAVEVEFRADCICQTREGRVAGRGTITDASVDGVRNIAQLYAKYPLQVSITFVGACKDPQVLTQHSSGRPIRSPWDGVPMTAPVRIQLTGGSWPGNFQLGRDYSFSGGAAESASTLGAPGQRSKSSSMSVGESTPSTARSPQIDPNCNTQRCDTDFQTCGHQCNMGSPLRDQNAAQMRSYQECMSRCTSEKGKCIEWVCARR